MISAIEDTDKNKFLSALAHELRNPLASILSTVELMNAQGTASSDTSELLAVVDDRVRAMAHVLNDFLDASSLSYNTRSIESNPAQAKSIPPLSDTAKIHDKDAVRILVVDDNKSAADSLGQLLSLRGYQTAVAYSGSEALEAVRTCSPQIAILDIGMPEMDGYELVQQLQAKQFDCTYIALTGYGQQADKERTRTEGFAFHIIKPASFKQIETSIKEILRNKKEQTQ